MKQDNDLGPLTIDGKIDGNAAKLTLADATIQLDQIMAQGTYVVTRTHQHQELDLDNVALYGGKGGGRIVVDEGGPTPHCQCDF